MNLGRDGVGYGIGSAISISDYKWGAPSYSLKKLEVSRVRIHCGSPKDLRRTDIHSLAEGTPDNIPRLRSECRFAQPWRVAGDVNGQRTMLMGQTWQLGLLNQSEMRV
jgi:hypothetical protein